MGKPDSSSTAHGAKAYNTVFVDTSIDTHLVLIISAMETISGLKEKIHCEHPACFPDIGDITIHSIKVKRRKKFYNLSDSMFVKSVFEGVSISWFVFVDVSTVGIRKHSSGPSKRLTNTDDVSMPLLETNHANLNDNNETNHANLNDNKSIQEASPDPLSKIKEKEDLNESSRKNETSNHLSQEVVMIATSGKDAATSGKDATGTIPELREVGVERKDLSGEPVTGFALLQVSNGGINFEPCPTSLMVKLFDPIQKIGLKDDEVDDIDGDKEKRLSMIIDQKASTGIVERADIVERVGADGGVDPGKSIKRKKKSKKQLSDTNSGDFKCENDHHLKIEKPTLGTVHDSEGHHGTNVEENSDLLGVLEGNNTEMVGFETNELISSGKDVGKEEVDIVERVGADGGVDPEKSIKRKKKSKKDHHLKIEKPTLDTVHHASEEHHVTNVEGNSDLLRVLEGNTNEKVGFETNELISSGKDVGKEEADTVIQNVLISLQRTNEDKKSSDRTNKKPKKKATKKISAAAISVSGLQTIDGNVSSKDLFSDNLVASQPKNQIDALGEMHIVTNKKESNEKKGKVKRKKHDSHFDGPLHKSYKNQNGAHAQADYLGTTKQQKSLLEDNISNVLPNSIKEVPGSGTAGKLTLLKKSQRLTRKNAHPTEESKEKVVASKSRLVSSKGQNGERNTNSLSHGAKDLSLHKLLTNSSSYKKAKLTASRLQPEDLDLVPDGQL